MRSYDEYKLVRDERRCSGWIEHTAHSCSDWLSILGDASKLSIAANSTVHCIALKADVGGCSALGLCSVAEGAA